MKCPFCKHNLNIPETSLSEGDFHYDCPYCNSSLLFEKDKCQVLAEGTLPEPSVSSEASSQVDEGEEKEEKQNSTNEVPSIDESTLDMEEVSSLEHEKQENLQQEVSSDEKTALEKKSEDFSDVEKFGNTTGRTHQGPFYYNLLIEEINSKETREHLHSVLNDEGLNLPPIKIKDGILKLHRLTPAATHVIVKSLLGWSLKISWEQELAVEVDDEESSDEVGSDDENPNDKDLSNKATPDEITSDNVGSDGADPDGKSDEM